MQAAVLLLFFLSGAAGLVYEVVWTRQLSLIFGVTTYAVATVLATFMAGLALGSYVLGRWVDRARNALLVYAALEAGVGFYALVVPSLLAALRPAYVLLHRLDVPHPALAFGRAVLAALLLLLPTTLMGGTFPVLVRFFVRARDEVGRTAGTLYFVNTAGALAGCLGAGFLLIERLGLVGASRSAAAMSLGAAAVAAWLARRALPAAAAPRAESRSLAPEPARETGAMRVALLAIGISGFTALAYEVLWSRALLRYLYNSTYAFTTMLATFLAGLAIGSAIHATVLRRWPRRLLVFGVLELLVGLGFVASGVLFVHLMDASGAILGGNVVASFWQSVRGMFVRAGLILSVPAVFLGATVPLAADVCLPALALVGAGVGRVYAVNTLGAILGSLGAAFVLIPALGMQGTLRLLIGLNFLAGVLLIAAERPAGLGRLVPGAVLTAALAGVLLLMPADIFVRTFAPGMQLLFYHEGATDTVGVVEVSGQRAMFYDDRRGTASTASYRWNFFLGHLPLLLHPGEPRNVLHICFGVGNSLSAVAAHDSVERVDNVELSPHVLQAAKYFWTNNDVITNPKVHTIIDDGRNFLMVSRDTYDVILLEPPEVFTAGVINLFSREFYRDAAARLAPDGVMLQWLPVSESPIEDERMLFRAFYDVFPDATAWKQLDSAVLLLIGTKRPLSIDYQALRAKVGQGRVASDLELIGVRDVDHLLSFFVWDSPAFRDFALAAAPVTDDRTVLDFTMPRYLGSGFGLGFFSPLARRDGLVPASLVGEHASYFAERKRSVVPYLRNLGADTPETIGARIMAEAARPPVGRSFSESEWRRW